MDGKGLMSSPKTIMEWTMGLDTSGRFFSGEKHCIYRVMDVGSLRSRCVPEVSDQREVGERTRIFFSVVYIWVTFIGAS